MTDPVSAHNWLSAYDRIRTTWPYTERKRSTLEEATATAVRTVPNACSASITRSDGGPWTTLVAVGPRAARMDNLRRSHGDDTYLLPSSRPGVVHSGDLMRDDRWPEFGPAAAQQIDVNSLLTVPVVSTPSDGPVAVSLYSSSLYAFTERDIVTALLVAADIAGCLTTLEHRVREPQAAADIRSSWDMGVATGRVMTRYGVTTDEAFTLLRLASQYANRGVRQVAADVAHTGELGLPLQPSSPPNDLTW